MNATTNILPSDITSFSFNNGVTTFSSGDPNVRVNEVRVTTVGGNVTTFNIWLNRWRTLPHTTADDETGRFEYLLVSQNYQLAIYNLICDTVGTAPSGTTDTCTRNGTGVDTTRAETSVRNTLTAPAPAPVPTLSEWAMILLGLMLAGGAAIQIQRRRLMA